MGTCQYRFSATESYKRTLPGMAPESCCGARTYPAQDEPELAAVQIEFSPQERLDAGLAPGQQAYRQMFTGRYVNRAQDDPHCPAHGGSAPPPPEAPSWEQIEAARQRYEDLAALAHPGAGAAGDLEYLDPVPPRQIAAPVPAQEEEPNGVT